MVVKKVDVYPNNIDFNTSEYIIYSSFSNTTYTNRSNIDLGTVFSSDFKWIAHHETDLYTCEIIVLYAMH